MTYLLASFFAFINKTVRLLTLYIILSLKLTYAFKQQQQAMHSIITMAMDDPEPAPAITAPGVCVSATVGKDL